MFIIGVSYIDVNFEISVTVRRPGTGELQSQAFPFDDVRG